MKEWTTAEWETNSQSANIAAYYLYAPMCGTCQVASKMLEVVEELLPNVQIGQANLNYIEDLAIDQKIESVPCLIIAQNGQIQEKIYAFQSVPFLYNQLRKKV
ncbi:thioredoxin family protein [Paenisporosarcina antarctica]|uniref:Thioredoxin n=1 Tax=Paenisporosarcina antarctica TaxID=417367 RepID=A0A4V1AMU8_9BACL|nr:thioredoxin family protein [Paenisporosarcina antarctica]QBP40525.1 thioredoxin [Paenisporosarcina antarctica]